MTERWRSIPGFEDYLASDRGGIKRSRPSRGARAGHILAQRRHGRYGHLVVDLYRQTTKTTCYVHKLVALTFLGPPPKSRDVVRHLNGQAGDNRLENLIWGTKQEDAQDRLRHKTQARGSRHGMSKLTESKVASIRAAITPDRGCITRLAKQFGVSPGTISNIKHRRNWNSLEAA